MNERQVYNRSDTDSIAICFYLAAGGYRIGLLGAWSALSRDSLFKMFDRFIDLEFLKRRPVKVKHSRASSFGTLQKPLPISSVFLIPIHGFLVRAVCPPIEHNNPVSLGRVNNGLNLFKKRIRTLCTFHAHPLSSCSSGSIPSVKETDQSESTLLD